MKYNTTIVFLCILAVMLCIGVTGCSGEKKYRIGVSQCSSDDWRTKMNDEIQREILLHPEAEVEIRSADDSNSKQIADINYFKDNGFDIIIAAPNEADAITPVIKEVYESGTPVIVFDRDINGDFYTARHGVDNYGIGAAAARYAHHLVGGGGKVLEIYGLSGSTPARERHNGFYAQADSLGLRMIASAYGDWNHDDAARVTDSLLNLYPDIDLIYAHNDRMAIAASEVAHRHGKQLRTIGIDAAPEIGIKAVSNGIIDATFLYPTEGYRLIQTALAILKGETYEKNTVMPQSSAVDKSNADILLLQDESLKEETLKIKKLKTQMDDYWTQHSAQTALFYSAIVILILLFGVLFMTLRAFWEHRRHQQELMAQNSILHQQRDTEKRLNEQLNVATQSKLMFFTNVSHDLRTPLTLIAEPVEQLAQSSYLTPQHKTLMQIANKNVKILRRLINQILDFRKYENGKLNVNLTEVRPSQLFTEWSDGFRSMARKRDIKLSVCIDLPDDFTLALDVEKIERVFYNLLSNAFKYTPDNGHITVSCNVDGDKLFFSVSDTGQGIAEEDLGSIFDRFYQVDKVHPNGSGIGLSLAKAFVELHGGDISVDSHLNIGSTFRVEIPVRHVAESASYVEKKIGENEINTELGSVEGEVTFGDDKPLILLIDDNADIRCMIGELLGGVYNVLSAAEGMEGMRKAAKHIPDLIICDVMMPGIDGMECCRRLKSEVTTSHIPVLMLTACSMDEQRVQGYDSGADGYLSKPFSTAVLKSRCASLISNRKRIKQLWGKENLLITKKTEKKETSKTAHGQKDIDNDFYNRFIEIFNSSMNNPDTSVDSLATSLGLERTQFYRKIKALTNYSPVELMRNLRLKKARVLVSSTEKTISEIGYEVGFSTPAYFTKCYREAYGETPSETRSKIQG